MERHGRFQTVQNRRGSREPKPVSGQGKRGSQASPLKAFSFEDNGVPCSAYRESAAFLPGREKPSLLVLDRQRRQHAAAIGARIDGDAIRPLLHGIDDRVAMDDDEAVLLRVRQEGLADPAQVAPLLLVEADAGTDAGVDEEIISEAERVAEAFEELDMAARDVG